MKFTVNREKFQKALQRVGSIIGSRSMLPMLGNVLIEAGEGVLQLTTTDLELRITTSVEAEVSEAGSGTLPARRLTQLVSSFIAADISFDMDAEDHCRIVCGTAKFRLNGLPAADFPEKTGFETVRSFKVPANELKRMISSISYAVSFDDSRKVLTGVLVSLDESKLTMVATDGKRMAMREHTLEDFSGNSGDAIVPIKAVQEAKRILDGDEAVSLEFGDKQCRITAGNVELISKLIEGNYPPYDRVIPKSFSKIIEIPVQMFLAKIDMVSLMLSESRAFITLSFEDNQLKITAASSEVGEGSDVIAVEYTNEPLEVAFNPVFLADPMRNTVSETVRVKVNDGLTPMALETEEGFLYVIMPIRPK